MDRLEQPSQLRESAVGSTGSVRVLRRSGNPDSDPNDPKTWRASRKPVRPLAKLLVDERDRDLLAWQWFACADGYARRAVRTPAGRVTVYVHRIVLARVLGRPLSDGEFADHVNGTRLDNRRANLRVASALGNSQNVHRNRRNKAGGLRGVSWHAQSGKWQAVVRHRGRNQYLGLFTNPEEAAAVAARRRAELGFLSDRAANQSMELGNDGNAAAAA